MNMVQGVEESVMSVKVEMEGGSSPFSRARSPTYVRTSSLEEIKCSQCDEAMGPCKTDHTEEEMEENICSIALEGDDKMDEGDNIPKLEVSHISCIRIDTGNPSLNSYTSTMDISPPLPCYSTPSTPPPPHPPPTPPTSPSIISTLLWIFKVKKRRGMTCSTEVINA